MVRSPTVTRVTGGDVRLSNGSVGGLNADLRNFGFSLRGASSSTVLFNFFEASALSMQSLALQGSVLAPLATVTGSSGVFHGDLVAASYDGSHTFGRDPLAGSLPSLPEGVGGSRKQEVGSRRLLIRGGWHHPARPAPLGPLLPTSDLRLPPTSDLLLPTPSNSASHPRLICTSRSRASRLPVGVAASPPPAVSR